MKNSNPFDLKGRVALVTGGSGHLGWAFSQALARQGAKVIIASRDLENNIKHAQELGPEHAAMRLDLADEKSIHSVVDDVAARLGSLDILVNNGYFNPTSPDHDKASTDDFQKAFQIGVSGAYAASRYAAVHMKKKGKGSIINIASMYGLVGSYPEIYQGLEGFPINSAPNYHAVKGSLIHLTRYLAVYWAAAGIRVNAISPGPFPPSRVADAPKSQEFLERLKKRVPMGRLGNPEDLEGALLLLASDAGNFITGQNIVVDGGWTAW